jgi:thiol-disulfide isomerase/thioredoxin
MMGQNSGRFHPARFLSAGLLLGLAIGVAVFFGFPSSDEAPGAARPAATDASSEAVSGLPAAQSAAAPVVGAPAPDFELTSLDGASLRLTDLRGQVVALNFWATWCAPCRDEMPLLEAALEKYGAEGLAILAIDADEPASLVTDFRDELGVSLPLLLDPGGEVQQLYRVRGYPTTYFVDRDGVIQVQHMGILSEGQLERYLGSLGFGTS